MSGYLSRLAARAAGAPAAAAPRLPSLFESGAGSGRVVEGAATAAVETSAPAASAGKLASTTDNGHTGTAPGVPARAALDAQPMPSQERAAAAARDVAGAVAPQPASDPARGAEPRHPKSDPETSERATEPANAAAEAVGDGVASPVALPRMPLSPARSAERGAGSERGGSPEVVHVTIGRVEVRASVTAQPAAARPHPAEGRDGLSLHDYLRGGRSR